MRYHLGVVLKSVECDICGSSPSLVVASVESVHGWACCEACFNMWLIREML